MGNNFKTIKDTVSRIIFEGQDKGDKELISVWKDFINEVKSSPILKTLYIVYNNIENNNFEDKDTAEIFLNENLMSFGSFSKKEILAENLKVSELLKGHINEELSDNLFNLILESTKDRKLSNLNKRAELFNSVSKSLIKEDVNNDDIQEEPILIESSVMKRAIEIVNERYSFLNSNEKGILKAFLYNDEEKKKEYFDSLIKENLNYIKRTLIEHEGDEDDELTVLLTLTEEKLKGMEYTSDTPIGKFSELINFKKN